MRAKVAAAVMLTAGGERSAYTLADLRAAFAALAPFASDYPHCTTVAMSQSLDIEYAFDDLDSAGLLLVSHPDRGTNAAIPVNQRPELDHKLAFAAKATAQLGQSISVLQEQLLLKPSFRFMYSALNRIANDAHTIARYADIFVQEVGQDAKAETKIAHEEAARDKEERKAKRARSQREKEAAKLAAAAAAAAEIDAPHDAITAHSADITLSPTLPTAAEMQAMDELLAPPPEAMRVAASAPKQQPSSRKPGRPPKQPGAAVAAVTMIRPMTKVIPLAEAANLSMAREH